MCNYIIHSFKHILKAYVTGKRAAAYKIVSCIHAKPCFMHMRKEDADQQNCCRLITGLFFTTLQPQISFICISLRHSEC